MRKLLPAILSACVILAGASAAFGQAANPASPGDATGAVAYPDNPSNTPAAANGGAPVVTDRAACGTAGVGRCPDRPQPSASAGSVGSASDSETARQEGGVKVPSTAYPDSPVPTPATQPDGKAPN